jgi:hypothetical protein
MITIEKTVDISADGKIHLDLTLPPSVPSGKTSIVLMFPTAEPPASGKVKPKTKESMLAAIDRLCGLYAGVEPPGAYLERHHAENLLEWEIEERREKERDWDK